jgi:predicted ATPase
VPINDEMRRLQRRWSSGNGWPQRLEWIEVRGIRGWTGNRLTLSFPMIALTGENGSGKSTLLQAAACVYRADPPRPDDMYFPSEFFPDTAWDQIRDASIQYGYLQGNRRGTGSIRKPTTRWLGHGERPVRPAEFIDLNRIQPVSTRVGYARIAKIRHEEKSSRNFDEQRVGRLSAVMGHNYDTARMALSNIDDNRHVPVISQRRQEYSGFHQGSGEMMVTELLQADLPRNGLILIDEFESSLHPRAQRRLIRDLAEQCRQRELQIILSTHSPFVLDELPLEARMYILENQGEKRIVPGVSPQFAMTKMDDDQHPECDVFVEDHAAAILLAEILAFHGKELFPRCAIVPCGAASVGYALGQMVASKRFPRPTRVFLDGDADEAPGCTVLPGGDPPERVVFNKLRSIAPKWGDLWTRVARDISAVDDACTNAMVLGDHHEWVRFAANQLFCGGDTFWQAMCVEWAKRLPHQEAVRITQPIEDALG